MNRKIVIGVTIAVAAAAAALAGSVAYASDGGTDGNLRISYEQVHSPATGTDDCPAGQAGL